MSALFITATGTDVGKTFVTAGLVRHLRRLGHEARALKPIISGFDDNRPAASDCGVLLEAMGRPMNLDEMARISPWRFKAPLSPDMAARLEERTIDFPALAQFSREAVDASRNVLLIEGVGGVMAPLDGRHTVIDWMAELGLPVVLVAGSYLGTISHTLTALDVLQRRDLRMAAIVVSETENSSVDLGQTVDSIARFANPVEVVGIPRLSDAAAEHPAFDRLAMLLMRLPTRRAPR